MTIEQAQEVIITLGVEDLSNLEYGLNKIGFYYDETYRRGVEKLNFDYLAGRVMKVSLTSDTLRTWAYNRDNGHMAAEKIICSMHAEKSYAEKHEL